MRQLPVIWVLGLALLLAAGCSTGSTQPDRQAEESPAADGPTGPPGSEVPATRSGPLTKSDLPSPEDLGADWKPYADPGGHGYQGNGSFVRERAAKEVAMSLVPLGCSDVGQAPGLPVPAHALEATFRDPEGRAAVAIVLEYNDEATATALVEQLSRLLANCPKPAQKVDRPTLTVDLLLPNDTTIHDVRREVGPGASPEVWSEVVVREGSRVGLTIVQSDEVDFDGLTSRLRAAVG